MRKIISILLVCIATFSLFSLTGCDFNMNDLKEGIEKLEQLESEYQQQQENEKAEENTDLFTKGDVELQKMINQNRSIIKEIDWEEFCNEGTGAGNVLKYWVSPIGFDGFQGGGEDIDFMSFLPDDCYFGHSLNFESYGEKVIDYRLNFFEDFSQINTDSIALKLKGIFDADINKEILTSTIEEYKTKIAENTEEDKVVGSYILYDENDIVIKISAINNKGTEFIAVVGYYLNPYYNN